MDLITSRTMEVSRLALDGLLERQKAVGANIANVETPGYQRKEVEFESQLSEIIERENLKDYIKGQNSIKYTPTTIEGFMEPPVTLGPNPHKITAQEKAYLQTNSYDGYCPQILDDVFSEGVSDGNNVELEKEVMDLNKVGTKYSILASLEKKAFTGIGEVIKG